MDYVNSTLFPFMSVYTELVTSSTAVSTASSLKEASFLAITL